MNLISGNSFGPHECEEIEDPGSFLTTQRSLPIYLKNKITSRECVEKNTLVSSGQAGLDNPIDHINVYHIVDTQISLK